MAATKLTHSKHAHITLETCGHKVCVIDGVNANRGKIDAGHIRELERFHAAMHKVEAKKRAQDAKRTGDGKIEGVMGGRLSAKQVLANYEREKDTVGDQMKNVLAPYLNNHRPGEKAHPFPLKSKLTGRRKVIPAGYRPKRRPAQAAAEASL